MSKTAGPKNTRPKPVRPESARPVGSNFPSTDWSSIRKAGCVDGAEGRHALGELLTHYQSALLAYAITRFQLAEDDARDLFQSFTADAVLRRDLIGRARPRKGYQFRSYLLTAWHMHIQGEYRKQHARKRRPSAGLISLEEYLPEIADSSAGAPESFDVEWARTVIAQAAERMRTVCVEKGKGQLWGVFEQRILKPICEDVEMTSYEDLVSALKIDSPMQARNLLASGKQLFTRCLREVVGEYARGDAAAEAELRELYLILATQG